MCLLIPLLLNYVPSPVDCLHSWSFASLSVSLKPLEQVKWDFIGWDERFILNASFLICVGIMAMPRSPVHDHYEAQTEHSYEESEAVDASLLPPG